MRPRAVGQVGAPDALGAAAHRRAGALHMADEPRPRGGAQEEQEEGRAVAEPSELIRLKCANYYHKGNLG